MKRNQKHNKVFYNMLDILGREVSRGDVIVYGTMKLCGYNKFTRTHLGVVRNIIAGGKEYTIKHPGSNKPAVNLITGKIVKRSPMAKVTFYPLNDQITFPQNVRLTKNGKRKYNPLLTHTFLIIEKSMLNEKQQLIYDLVCKDFKICV